jgi:hypothetical protein
METKREKCLEEWPKLGKTLYVVGWIRLVIAIVVICIMFFFIIFGKSPTDIATSIITTSIIGALLLIDPLIYKNYGWRLKEGALPACVV